ncbi:MAG: discoidin domain-containing protein [Bacteroidaceae bacterium]|nr:discoidin domain-containing protein [Bacteroidaceae bacterium]
MIRFKLHFKPIVASIAVTMAALMPHEGWAQKLYSFNYVNSSDETFESYSLKVSDVKGNAGIGEDENAENLFDGKTSTKWCAKLVENEGASVSFNVDKRILVQRYVVTTANDDVKYQRTFKHWYLQGSNDSSNWTTLHEGKSGEFGATDNFTAHSFDVPEQNRGYYSSYRLLVTEAGKENIAQVSELSFIFQLPEEKVMFGMDNESGKCEINLSKIGSYYYTSLYTDFSYTCSQPVYAVTGVDTGDGVITLTKIEGVVPASTGVVIRGEESDDETADPTKCVLTFTKEEPAVVTSLLKGSSKDVEEASESQLAFSLNKRGYIGFWGWTGKKIPAWKAYLELEWNSESKGYRMEFDEMTGIEDVVESQKASDVMYDLSGRKVSNPANGIYIMNGKKIYVKK